MKQAVSALALILIAAAVTAHAQDINGNVTGVVTDQSGAVVPNASVTAVHTGTNARFSTRTDSGGLYTLRSIPVGVYDLMAEAAGFTKYEGKGIRLQVNETARVDVSLKIGAAAETVTVSAEAVTVDTTTSTLKAVVDQKRIEELPLNGRNPTQLMRLVVGTVTDARADVTSGTTYPGVVPVSVNGSRANATNYVLDGAQNNDHYSNAPNPMPNPDALQEFSVQTNNFSAEFGRQSGGVVNAVTKSGSNDLHGSAFEFVRNKALNAKPFFAPVVSGRKSDDGLKRNQFGATVGGPVWLPRLYNGRDKSFFFFSYQGTLERRTPNEVNRVVPTAAQRRGDFSALGRQLRDPVRGGFYPNNQIPESDLSPIAQSVLKFVPLPASGNRISFAAPSNYDDHQFLVRIDQRITSANQLTGRFWNSRAETPAFLNPRNYLENTVGRTWLNRSTSLTDTHVFSPNFANQALFSFNRTDGNNIPIYPENAIADLGSKYYNDKMPQWHVTVVGYFDTLNTGDTNRFLRDEYQFIDTVRWTHGRHQLTLGGDYGRGIGDVVNNFRANGQWNFNGSSAPFTGDSLADFLIGRFNTLTQGIGEYKMTRFHRLSLFAQDAFRMTRRFTLDFGVRWEPFFPFTDVDGKLAVWRPGERSKRYVNAPAGVLYPADPGIPDGGVSPTWSNFGPRLGFAWDIFGDGRTSLRGGYGVFFDQLNTIATNNQANQAPFGTVVTTFGSLSNSFADPYAGTTNPFPASTTPPSTVAFPRFSSQTVYAPDYRNPYVQSWNLTLEREVAFGFVARASYAASKGTHLGVMRELNAALYSPGATTGTTNDRRPYAPALGSTSILEPAGNSIFHALQLTAERRFANGFSILANYQFSKAIDDSSNSKATGQSRTNPNNQRFDRGPADFDRTHVFNFSALWELPSPAATRVLRTITGGWSLNGIATMWSGYPFSVASGADNARTGTGGQRAELRGNPYLPDSRSRGEKIGEWLSRAAFAPNTLGTFGTLGRNVFRGPGYASVDLGLFKRFAITERVAATFRFEAFNAFNRVNLAGPNTTLNNANFMRTNSALDNRILQLALRTTW
ncbi:MAG TPA: carboxypeptidase regulatory-like domain-containing protein [Bryobacteraceae bacterium]|nr:carboxypeptidase regulatory-like domain-containing protein [Bryobacteraceae bacterium]